MYISQELRKKNIAEYLLYMWQVEDIIRAYGCSLSRLRHEYISQFDYDEEQKEDLTDWYGNLIRMMNQEGVREKGHIQILRIIVQDLSELHAMLLESVKFPFYTAEEGSVGRDRPCHGRDQHADGHAVRLLSERQDRRSEF